VLIPTFAEAFEAAVAGQPIEAAVIGGPPASWVAPDAGIWLDPTVRPSRPVSPATPDEQLRLVPLGEVVPWIEAREALAFAWDDGWGVPDTPPVVALSASHRWAQALGRSHGVLARRIVQRTCARRSRHRG